MNTDRRSRDFVITENSGYSRVSLLEFPSDIGVKRNGGREGAAKAPELIRAQILNLTPHPEYYEEFTGLLEKVAIDGFVPTSGDLEKDQENLGNEIAKRLKEEKIQIVLGGGHETSFGHFLGYVKAGKPVSILNVDAHTDVRPLKDGKPHSGSPFRQAVEHSSSICKSYNVVGLNPSTVAFEHFSFVQKQGKILFEPDTNLEAVFNILEGIEGDIMVTMDMDAVSQAEAPGVSAPNSSGMSSKLWLELALEFGKHHSVSSFDLCEVNPVYDVDNRTVRLAAMTVWYFLLGVALRYN